MKKTIHLALATLAVATTISAAALPALAHATTPPGCSDDLGCALGSYCSGGLCVAEAAEYCTAEPAGSD